MRSGREGGGGGGSGCSVSVGVDDDGLLDDTRDTDDPIKISDAIYQLDMRQIAISITQFYRNELY